MLSPSDRLARPFSLAAANGLAAAVLLGGWVLSALIVNQAGAQMEREAEIAYTHRVDQLTRDIEQRFAAIAAGLQSLQALHGASQQVEAGEFEHFVHAWSQGASPPGLMSFGVVEPVPRAQREAFLRRQRAQAPDFPLRPDAGGPQLWVLRQVAPLATHHEAWGQDLAGEPALLAGLQQASDSGLLTLAGRLPPSGPASAPASSPAGMSYLMPLDRLGPAAVLSPAQRRPALRSVLLAAIRTDTLLADLNPRGAAPLAYTLRDAEGPAQGQTLAAQPNPPDTPARFRSSRSLRIGQHTLLLETSSTPAFDASQPAWSSTVLLGAACALLSLMLAVAVWSLASARARALALAAAMGNDLERLSTVAERTTSAVMVMNAQARIVWVNQAFTSLSGYSADEARGRLPFELLRSEQVAPQAQAALQQAYATGQSFHAELPGCTRSGRTWWSRVEVRPLHDDLGQLTGFMSICTDITALHEAHDALARERHRTDTLLASLPGAVCEFEPSANGQGRFLFISASASAVLGMAPAALLADTTPLFKAMPAEDGARLKAALRTSAQQMAPLHAEFRLQVGDALRWVGVDALPHRRSHGGLVWYGMLMDISARKQVDERLAAAMHQAEAANRAQSAFLATMSHEIRTPMNGVLGMAELLAESPLSEDQADTVHTMRESALSLLRLIDDILDFSRIEAGRLMLERTPVRLGPLVAGLCDALQPVAIARQVELRLFCDPRLPEQVLTDPVRLRQIIHHLLGNAIKFSAGLACRRGRVTLRVEPVEHPAGQVRFEVIDNGIGMDAATIARIFQPFTQAEGSSTRRFGGTGLGLSISERLARLLDGEIQVRSEPGLGTTFELTLPLHPAQPLPTEAPPDALAPSPLWDSPAPAPLPPAQAAPRLILVAEDDPVNQKVIQRQLTLLGHSAEVVDNGRQALQRWREGRHALLLTDLHMPELDGYDLTAQLRREEADSARLSNGTPRRIPVLALTANALKSEEQRALAAGMDGYLTKPVPLQALRRALDNWLPPQAESGAPPAAPASGLPVLHLPTLCALVGSEPAAVESFLQAFRDSARLLAEQLRQAHASGETRQLAALAHKLKTSCRSVGALALGEHCARLAQPDQGLDAPGHARKLADFNAAFGALETALAQALQEEGWE